MEASLTKRREDLQDGRASTPGGEDLAFQHIIKGVLQKKAFNEERRNELSLLAQKCSVGMSMAAMQYRLTPDCMAAFSDRFVQGEFDKEIERTTQPTLVGPICSWVRHSNSKK